MQLCKFRTERLRVGKLFNHRDEVANVEVFVRIGLISAPTNWPWHKVGYDRVCGTDALVFASNHIAANVSTANLEEIRLGRAVRESNDIQTDCFCPKARSMRYDGHESVTRRKVCWPESALPE